MIDKLRIRLALWASRLAGDLLRARCRHCASVAGTLEDHISHHALARGMRVR